MFLQIYAVSTGYCQQAKCKKMQRLKERLVSRRNALNLSQVALAGKSGVSERAIAAYETGESTPTHSRLEKLASALSVSPAWLLGGDEPSTPGRFGEGKAILVGAGASFDLGRLPMKVLEDLFASLGAELKQSSGEERAGIMNSLAAVHKELQRREEPKPKLEGKGISSDVKEIALGSVDIASHMARRAAGQEGQQKNKAASPSDKKHGPSGGAPPPKGSGSEDR
jgi:transcriptional regulator with XRE-family HTH domain